MPVPVCGPMVNPKSVFVGLGMGTEVDEFGFPGTLHAFEVGCVDPATSVTVE